MKLTSHTHTPVARPTRAAAFTLVELLTVIAIIAVLAAILIPTVGTVRGTARKSACATNLRQIALATLSYAGDNRGQLPGAKTVNASTGAVTWTSMYRAIRNPAVNAVDFSDTSSVESSRQYATQLNGYLDTTKEDTLWRCPANTAGVEASLAINSTNETTYLLNHRSEASGTARHLPFGGSGLRPARLNEIVAAASAENDGSTNGRRWSTMTEHSQIWMITDLDSLNYGGQSSYPTTGVPMPHSGGRNYAFFDGHVEYRKADKLPANSGDRS